MWDCNYLYTCKIHITLGNSGIFWLEMTRPRIDRQACHWKPRISRATSSTQSESICGQYMLMSQVELSAGKVPVVRHVWKSSHLVYRQGALEIYKPKRALRTQNNYNNTLAHTTRTLCRCFVPQSSGIAYFVQMVSLAGQSLFCRQARFSNLRDCETEMPSCKIHFFKRLQI